ncbi:hypothetical protein [Parageobacillus thermoglucosidasius]|nr:hypothetical protein [Parageobacillus thermoglucosidasius]KYD11871.1 hypothetical protein B4168_3721 [Anoxybacillus flavithermus]OAO88093.1 hypothetical protein GT23_0826 [Parageobacillus thermoglucosidasius]
MVIVRVPDAPMKKAQEHVLASFYAFSKDSLCIVSAGTEKAGPDV